MKFLRLKVDGFGPLRGEFRFDPAKLTLLVDENERGKSSLLNAIVAALYGLDDDRRSHRVLSPLDRWRPWSGGSYRVELELECRGEHLTITRDFDHGSVAVWDDRGQERTHEFVDGRDDYPIGKFLLGLDAEEFAKCAYLQHGELDQVVPDEEKARRGSTLHARLENAADSRGSDTNATETLQVLEGALARYTCDYLGKTFRVDTAIHRLETKLGFIETDIKSFEHEHRQLQRPLEDLAGLVEAEHQAQARLRDLELERDARLLRDARQALEEDDARRRAIERHREELVGLGPLAETPLDAEARFREALTRHQEARAYLESFDARSTRAAEDRDRLDHAMKPLERYAPFAGPDADRLAARGQELRRIREDDSGLRAKLDEGLERLSEHGFTKERIEALLQKIGYLPIEEAAFLRSQPATARAFQVEQAEVDKLEEEHGDTLASVSRTRRALYVPGWILFGLGLVAVLAGALGIEAAWAPLLVPAGIVAIAVSVALLLAGALAGGGNLRAAKAALTEIEDRGDQLRLRISRNERKLAELARSLDYKDASALLADWTELGRLTEQHAPVLGLREQVNSNELRLKRVIGDVREVLERTGHDAQDPTAIDAVASGIRELEQHRRTLAEWEKRWNDLAAQESAASEAVAERKADVLRVLEAVGVAHREGTALESHLVDVTARVEGARRHRWLVTERIPGLERALLSESERQALGRQIEWASPELGAATPDRADPRPIHEIEEDISRANEAVNARVKEQSELRVVVDRREHAYLSGHAEALREREVVERALRRAVRFKRAVTLAAETIKTVAADTHRRWADFLNFRVGELLRSVGADIEQVRFGDDLDFAVKPRTGPQMARGKATFQLSSGARDQLYLATRLAISEYLSRNAESLPMLLDDAFATSDDERVAAAMKLLIEHFARQHQMIVVTCHRARYQALREHDPELYAQRVVWLDVDAAAPVPHEQMELAPPSESAAETESVPAPAMGQASAESDEAATTSVHPGGDV